MKNEKGIQISDAEMKSVQLTPADFHGEWNYTITSRKAPVAQPSVVSEN